jgi:Ca2+-binding EF-hand superfamily protein
MGSELEKQMAALLAGASEIDSGVKDARKRAGNIRKKSRELDDALDGLEAPKFSMLTQMLKNESGEPDTSDEAIEALFMTMDADKSGSIDKSELTQAFKDMFERDGKPLEMTVIKNVVDEMFAKALKEDMVNTFFKYDLDGGGTIDRSELQEALKDLELTVSEEEITEIMSKDGMEGKEELDMDTFATLVIGLKHMTKEDITKSEFLVMAKKQLKEDGVLN